MNKVVNNMLVIRLVMSLVFYENKEFDKSKNLETSKMMHKTQT